MVNCIGIRDITQTDVSIAKKFGGAVKLVGSTKRMPDGTIDIRVTPCLVPPSNPMVKVDDVYNAIMVRAASLGDVMFYGQGAGSLPTGSAVLSDIMDIAKHLKTKQPTQETWESSDSGVVCDAETTPTSYYAAVNLTPDQLATYIEDIEVLYIEDGLTAFIAHGISHKSFEFALAAAGAQVFSKLRAL